MKKIIFVCVLIAGSVNLIQAQTAKQTPPPPPQSQQTPPSPQQIAQMQTDRMAEKLKLSDKQKQQVYQINLVQFQKMETAKKNHDRPAMQKIMEERSAQLKAILTPEQLGKMGGPNPQNKPGVPPPPAPTK